MSAKLLDGKLLAQTIKADLKAHVGLISAVSEGQRPTLASLMIGDDPGAKVYANSQKRTAEEVGIKYVPFHLSQETSQGQLLDCIRRLNEDSHFHGIMIHQPTPPQIDYEAAANDIDASKDIEGMSAVNLGKLILGKKAVIPSTPASIMAHLDSTKVDLQGKEAVVIGRSEIVGKPVAFLLLQRSATVTICHSATSKAGKLVDHVRRADIVISALGKPEFVKGDWIKEGAIVIDVGINKIGDKIVGDVEFAKARERASFITPVPGGVGPVTVVELLNNCFLAYLNQTTKK